MQGGHGLLLSRRRFLAGATAFGVSLAASSLARASSRRVVVVGGGWGGLAAARWLREFAPELEVTLLERNPAFWSCPLSNLWLVGGVDDALLTGDFRAAAARWGYRFVQAEVVAIDRDKRQVIAGGQVYGYDWLILSIGIRHDYAQWFGEDRDTAAYCRRQFPGAWTPGPEFAALRESLERMKGGTLLMTVPPSPYRCPPAPYERAILLAEWFARRKLPVRLVVLDPNTPPVAYERMLQGAFPGRLDYRSQTHVTAVDPRRRVVETEFDAFEFDHAILMPRQQAGDLAWQAGLIGHGPDGRPTGWVPADPFSYRSTVDERVFVIGDMMDRVSPAFGHYPKAGQLASRQGRIVARQIAKVSRGETPPAAELPDSSCILATGTGSAALLSIGAEFRVRVDGAIVQHSTNRRIEQPDGENLAWLRGMRAELLAQ